MNKKVLIFLLILFLLSSCSRVPYKETRDLMDTKVTITLYAKNQNQAKQALNKAFEEIERIEKIFSPTNSELETLNKNKIINASKEFLDLTKDSVEISKKTNNSFDITVQPILTLYKESFQNKKRPPTKEEIETTLKLIGTNTINITNQQIAIKGELTFGGIAKGYAMDNVAKILKKENIQSALINAGGDILATSPKPTGDPWIIALQNPRNKNEYVEQIKLYKGSIATSGDYERYFDENKSFHHIVNPKTGYSATDLISLTIKAQTAQEADAFATALFVMGNNAKDYAKENNIKTIIITKNKTIYKINI